MKVLSVLAAMLVASSAQAWSNNYVQVQNGRTVAVNAAENSNLDGIVSLRVVVKNTSAHQEPTAHVFSEEDGFRCNIERILLLESSYDAKAKIFTQAYEVKVSWYPGKDWSSCAVEVQHPSLQKNSVVLYTEGDLASPIEEGPKDWY